MGSIKEGKCGVEDCNKKLECRGMCHKHYVKFMRSGGDKVNKITICLIEECDQRTHSKGYCKIHYLRIKRTGSPNRKYEDHGLRHTKEYKTWLSMKQRCLNPNSINYSDYGGRGITIYEEWKNSFVKFYDHIGKSPSPAHSVDRIDVNRNYEPGNVVWAIKTVQVHNQRVRKTSKSGIKGAHFRKDSQKWVSSISYKGQRHHLGTFETAEEASEAYQTASNDLFSEQEYAIPAEFIDKSYRQAKLRKQQVNRIMKQIIVGESADSCWEWKGRIAETGYGMVYFKDRTFIAHRALYEILIGDIPGRMQLNHDCHTKDKSCKGGTSCLHRRCVNPDHMSVVTPSENLKLDDTASGVNAKKTHCLRGHKFTRKNTRISYATGSKVRFCKQCDKLRNQSHQNRRRKIMAQTNQNLDPRTLGKTHCSNGHELTDETIRYDSKGYYYCILCIKDKQERYKEARHAKMRAEGREIRVGPKLKTHCKRGHPFDEANTYVSPSDGRRHCRICLARIARDQRAKQRLR